MLVKYTQKCEYFGSRGIPCRRYFEYLVVRTTIV